MQSLKLEAARSLMATANAKRSLDARMWRADWRFTVGTLYVLEPGIIVIETEGYWVGRLIIPTDAHFVLWAEPLMCDGRSFNIARAGSFGQHTVGGEIHHCGYPFWVCVGDSRDSSCHGMMSATEWQELRSWLCQHGLHAPES